MTGVDIILVLIVLFGAFRGYQQGFLMELFSLLAIVLGILAGFKLMGTALILLSDQFDIDKKILPYIAFAVVFLLVVIATTLVGKMLKASINKSFLGRVDEAAGAGLGILKTVFVISVVLWIVMSFKFELPGRWVEESALLPYVADVAPMVTGWFGELIPAFDGIFE